MNPVYEDSFNFLCDRLLGEGIHRKVFTNRFDRKVVVKVEDNGTDVYRSFANVREFDFWTYWKEYEPVAKWLAPCTFLSPNGRLMLQRRVDPLPPSYDLPDKLPKFLTDHKQSNFGLLDGRLVCVDYATTIVDASTKLRKAHFDK
jgi:hypothetical protein